MPKTEWSPAGAERTVKRSMAGVRRVQRPVRQRSGTAACSLCVECYPGGHGISASEMCFGLPSPS